MSPRFPRAPFAVAPQLSRRGELRLCRSAPAGSIHGPTYFDLYIYLGNRGETSLATQANACAFSTDTAVTSKLYQMLALQDVGSNRFL